jgi:hypothetical protein
MPCLGAILEGQGIRYWIARARLNSEHLDRDKAEGSAANRIRKLEKRANRFSSIQLAQPVRLFFAEFHDRKLLAFTGQRNQIVAPMQLQVTIDLFEWKIPANAFDNQLRGMPIDAEARSTLNMGTDTKSESPIAPRKDFQEFFERVFAKCQRNLFFGQNIHGHENLTLQPFARFQSLDGLVEIALGSATLGDEVVAIAL